MKFEPVDFNEYNKPPYLPQYLAHGDTKKLVSFDDEQFRELDRLIDKMSDQYDIEKAKGILLDRIGKILDMPRNTENDELYRLFLRLKVILNTTAGSINDIIKVIKFIFSSEVVHITQNYPAGLTILHDGEGPSINFNAIISQVVAAGVSYDTKELFYFTETIEVKEKSKIITKCVVMEEVFGQIKHNGRIARDGRTIRNTEIVYFQRNGTRKRDGTVQHKKVYRVFSTGNNIFPPFKHSSGVQDRLSLGMRLHELVDEYHGQVLRNAYFMRDKTLKHCNVNPRSASEKTTMTAQMNLVDVLPPMKEKHDVSVINDTFDDMNKRLSRRRLFRRNGVYAHSGFPVDNFGAMHGVIEPVVEVVGETTEVFTAFMRYHHFHNSGYRRNGNIRHNSNVLIPLE
jgi:hypothetical protein